MMRDLESFVVAANTKESTNAYQGALPRHPVRPAGIFGSRPSLEFASLEFASAPHRLFGWPRLARTRRAPRRQAAPPPGCPHTESAQPGLVVVRGRLKDSSIASRATAHRPDDAH